MSNFPSNNILNTHFFFFTREKERTMDSREALVTVCLNRQPGYQGLWNPCMHITLRAAEDLE